MADMWLHASCGLWFNVAVPTPMVLMLRPRSGPNQWVAREEYHLSPSVQVIEFTDGFGNLCQRLVAPVGDFRVYTSADVMVADQPPAPPDAPFVEVPALPHDVLGYLLPSRYCESDRFGDMATEIVGDHPPGFAQVAAITEWVRRAIRYTPGSSSYPISAVEVNHRGEGVCRDLAHIGIALCRALCIPARLVVGYQYELEPMDIHAWFEAFVGGQWHTFDPASSHAVGARIAIAHGRDATDVAIYNQYGPLLLPYDMRVTVERRDLSPQAR
jgi:transglutaminase-like putative cysteine protease